MILIGCLMYKILGFIGSLGVTSFLSPGGCFHFGPVTWWCHVMATGCSRAMKNNLNWEQFCHIQCNERLFVHNMLSVCVQVKKLPCPPKLYPVELADILPEAQSPGIRIFLPSPSVASGIQLRTEKLYINENEKASPV